MIKKICIILSVLILGTGIWFLYGKNPFIASHTVRIQIAENMTGREIAQLLQDKGVIMSSYTFRLYQYLTGTSKNLQRGTYELQTNMAPYAAIQALQNGRVEEISVSIPEGFAIKQIAKRLEEKGIIAAAEFEKEARHFVLPAEMQSTEPVDFTAEGFLFPDTYQYPPGTTALSILKGMNEEMEQRLTPKRRQEIKELGMSVHDFITLSSLVEKEAKYPEDRVLIAAVFKKRLAIGMPLQSCASIQYILGEAKPILSITDTRIPSPYNTYLHMGLPPGPIASPGEASMDAVLQSPPTEYLYFVSDLKGHHHFAKTYEEHEENIARIEREAGVQGIAN